MHRRFAFIPKLLRSYSISSKQYNQVKVLLQQFRSASQSQQQKILCELKKHWEKIPDQDVINITQKYTTPHYDGVIQKVFNKGSGIRLYQQDNTFYLCGSMAYGAARAGYQIPDDIAKELLKYSERVLPSRAVYTRELAEAHITSVLLLGQGNNFLGLKDAPLENPPQAMILNTGYDIIDTMQQGAKKIIGMENNPVSIICKNHFHGRAEMFNFWKYPDNSENSKPDSQGRIYVTFNNPEELKSTVLNLKKQNYSPFLFIEPVQGEGGVTIASPEFVKTINNLSKNDGLIVCIDEVQSFGCCPEGLASLRIGLNGHIIAFSKMISLGTAPIAVAIMLKDVAETAFPPGSAGGTYSGNPRSAKALTLGLQYIFSKNESGQTLLDRLYTNGENMKKWLIQLKNENSSLIQEIKGIGPMLGIQFYKSEDAQHFHHVLINLKDELEKENLLQIWKSYLLYYSYSPETISNFSGIIQKLSGRSSNIMRLTIGDGSTSDLKLFELTLFFVFEHFKDIN